MASLEQIIRPFVVYDTSPARAAPTSSGKAAQGNVILTIGKNPSAKTLGTSQSVTQTFYLEQKHNEFSTIEATGRDYGLGGGPPMSGIA